MSKTNENESVLPKVSSVQWNTQNLPKTDVNSNKRQLKKNALAQKVIREAQYRCRGIQVMNVALVKAWKGENVLKFSFYLPTACLEDLRRTMRTMKSTPLLRQLLTSFYDIQFFPLGWNVKESRKNWENLVSDSFRDNRVLSGNIFCKPTLHQNEIMYILLIVVLNSSDIHQVERWALWSLEDTQYWLDIVFFLKMSGWNFA